MVRTSLASQDHKKHYQDGDDDDNEYIYTYMEHTLHGKPYFLFPGVLKRWSFQKNCAGIWSFLYYRERWYFFFPKIWSYTLDGKWKMIFLKKYTEIWYFLQAFWKYGLSKRCRAGTWSFLYYLERWYFFPKTWYFFLNRKWETIFLKKYMEIYFLCAHTGVTNMAPRPSVKKSQRWSYPAKIHLKVIDVLDWHPRKSSSNSLYFHGDLYRRFHALLSSEKKNRKLNI